MLKAYSLTHDGVREEKQKPEGTEEEKGDEYGGDKGTGGR